MNDPTLDMNVDVETLEDQLDSIYYELDLALRWKRPSILFAIYKSKVVRKSAQASLEKAILESGQEVIHYQIEYEENLNLTQFVTEIAHKENTVFYIDPLNSEGKNSQIGHLISILNSCRGYLVDHLVRVVFWLTENEALNVAHQAPDFWASRHRVFDFVHDPVAEKSEPVDQAAFRLEKGKNMPATRSVASSDEDIPGASALVLDLSEGEEPTISGINLLLMMGVANWKEGNHEKACEPLQAALAIAKKSGHKAHQALCYKAIALVKSDSGKNDEAIQAYNQVVALAPENVTIWNNIGSLYQKVGQFDQAFNAFNNALKQDPNDPVSWNGLGSVYASTGQLDDAIGCFRKAIQFNAGYMTPWVKLGNVLLRQNRNEDALYAFLRTVEMDNKNVHAWSEIGSIYFKAGSFEQAVDAYKKALILGVDSAALFTNLADAYTHTGNYAEAIPNFQKAIERETGNNEKATLWNKLGDVYRRASDYEYAVSAYETADKLSTTLGDVAPATMPVTKQEEALQAVEKEIAAETDQDVDPDESLALLVVEEIQAQAAGLEQTVKPVASASAPALPTLQRVEDVLEPVSAIPSLSQSNPANAQLWTRLGSNYMKAGATDRAIDAYHKAVNLDPNNGQTCCTLAQAYAQKMDLTEAVSFYRKSVELFPSYQDKALSLTRIGDLYRQMKEFVDALEAFELALGFDPDNATILSGLCKIQEDLDQFSSLPGKPANLDPDHDDEPVVESIENPVPELAVAQAPAEAIAPIKINLNNANVWNELGNIFAKSKAYDEAVDAYNRAIELNPEFGWAYSNLALIFARQGKRAEAVNLYQKSIGLLWADADKAVAWNRLGDTYRQAGKYAEAIDAYQNADQLNQGNFATGAIREVNIEQLYPHFVA